MQISFSLLKNLSDSGDEEAKDIYDMWEPTQEENPEVSHLIEAHFDAVNDMIYLHIPRKAERKCTVRGMPAYKHVSKIPTIQGMPAINPNDIKI